jgi:hypothetical protein
MAKTTDKLATEAPAAAEPLPAPLKFADQVFTSRTLIIPKTRRTLAVTQALVEVAPDDTEALDFLKAHAEFKPLKE